MNLRNHGSRKFFQINAEPKMKSLVVLTLMGQDTGLAASYNKPTVSFYPGTSVSGLSDVLLYKQYLEKLCWYTLGILSSNQH